MTSVGYATLQVIPSVRGISSELRRQLIGPAEDAGDAAGDAAGGGFRDSFTGALAAIGVAEIAAKIGEQFTDAFAQSLEQAQLTGELKAQLGATSSDAARYGKVAGQLFTKGIVDDVQAGAEAVRATLSGGLVPPDATNKQLKSISAMMADVSTTFGSDMSMQSQAVSALLKNGLAPSAEAALDVITVGFQKLGPNAEDLLETFQEYPVQLRKLGLDSKTALGLFQQGLQGGARDTDILADLFKEFSIRAVDMSASSQTAYKALGLDAGKMSLQIAKGGESASSGLQTVLDKLREMKDPVAREAAAVGLFGTQAEDVGAALYKLDPSKALDVFGSVGGAARQLGKDLHSGPAHEIEVFQRSLKQGLVTVMGTYVLPLLATAGRFLNSNVLPPMKAIGSVVLAIVVPALTALWGAGEAVVNWLRDMGTWLIPIGILVAGFTAAIVAQQIATWAVVAVFGIYRGAILAWTAVQRGATIAQLAFNAVMNANPIILVITAIVALGAALVIAYQRSETFRSIVQAAWAGIQTAALYVWNSVLKPAFAGLMAGLSAVGAAFSWLWTSVIQPVFSFIDMAARILLTVITIVVFGPIYLAVKLLGAVFTWLWTNAISPVVGWIVAGLGLLWAGASVIFGYFTAGLRTIGGWATWLWTAAISPVVGWILAGFGLLWTGVSVIFGYFTGGLRVLGGWATWLWKKAISPAMSGAASVISTVYEGGIRPVLDKLKAAIGLVGAAFDAAKDAIKIAWDKVKGIAKAPVEFIINTVYNKGIVAVWNKVAGAFGAPKLNAMKFRRGGPVHGAGTETSDDVPAWLSKNEHVWTAREVRGAGGHGAVMAMRKWAAAGGNGRAPGFKDGGGLFGWIGDAGSTVAGWGSDAWDAVKAGASWLKDTLAASARAGVNAVVRPLLSQIPGLGSGIGDMIAKIPTRMVDALFGYADEADTKGASDAGGNWMKPVAAALGTRYGVAGSMWSSGHHTGSDFPAPTGTAVHAVARGTVSSAVSGGPYGQHILISHSGGLSSLYAHLSAMAVRAGQQVSRGARIGAVGATGNVTGPHLHLEARKNGRTINPEPLLGYANGGQPRPGEMFWVGERGPELMQLGGHGATVWDSQTSMQMAAGLGLRGFAKGTSNAKKQAAARKDLPGDLTSVSKILTASADDIKKAFAELTKDLKLAGGAGKALAASSSKASAKLQKMATYRDGLEKRIEEAKAAASDQRDKAVDYLGLGQVGDVTSFADLLGALNARQDNIALFDQQIAGLSKKGLSQSVISQLVEQGPDGPLIDMISGLSKSQIKQLNSTFAETYALSSKYGKTMADAMFDSGRNASKGFLTGLLSEKKDVQAAMDALAGVLVGSIKKKLKIKSPSRVTAWLGRMAGRGVGVGLDSTAAAVAASAARLADAATPELVGVSPASYAASTAQGTGGLASGSRLYLVLEDGRELAAYVDDRADGRVANGLRHVRRKVKAGTK